MLRRGTKSRGFKSRRLDQRKGQGFRLVLSVLLRQGVARDLLRPEPQYGDPALNDVFPCGQEKLKGMFSYGSDEKSTNFSVDALLSILSNLFNQVFNRTIKRFGEFV